MKPYRILAIGILLSSGCDLLGRSEVEIQNKSGFAVSNLNVLAGGDSVHIDRIAPGEMATVTYDPQGDSGLIVNYQSDQDSRARSCIGKVYVTTAADDHFVVIFNADGGCKVLTTAQAKDR